MEDTIETEANKDRILTHAETILQDCHPMTLCHSPKYIFIPSELIDNLKSIKGIIEILTFLNISFQVKSAPLVMANVENLLHAAVYLNIVLGYRSYL